MILRRIAYVVNVFPKLSETFIVGELAQLLRRGVEVRILSLRRPSETLHHSVIDHCGLIERTTYDPAQFADLLQEFRPQLVHAHFATEPADMAGKLAETLGTPFTFTAHGYDIYRRPPADFARRAAAADAVVTVSRANAQHIITTFGLHPDRLRVIPCGVDTDRFQPPSTSVSSISIRDDAPLMVCVARLVPVKNLGLLLEVCADLLARGLRFRCVLVGEGKSRHELEATHARLGLEGVVELIGAAEQSEVLRWWQRAAVAVLTSDNEGMPVSLMEAAACGVPAVAPCVGGIPELIEHGVTGLLTPRGDRQALVVALEELIRRPDVALQMGRAARRRAVKRFSIHRQIDTLVELWTGLLCNEVSICQSR